MNHSEEKRIQKKKRTGYNIYGIRDSLFYLLAALACAVILIALADLFDVSLDGLVGREFPKAGEKERDP